MQQPTVSHGIAEGELGLSLTNSINYYTLIICATSIHTTGINVSATWALAPYETSRILLLWPCLQRNPTHHGTFFPQAIVRRIMAAIWNPAELWDMGTISKVPLSLLCHCFISVWDKWQHFDLFYLIIILFDHGQNSVLCHYGNRCKYAVVSGDALDISLPASFIFPSHLPVHRAAFKAVFVAMFAVILPPAAAGVGREGQ